MKKILLIIAVLGITACSQPAPKATPGKQKQAVQCKYICIMDKDVCADKPGICPKCGMKLVEKEDK